MNKISYIVLLLLSVVVGCWTGPKQMTNPEKDADIYSAKDNEMSSVRSTDNEEKKYNMYDIIKNGCDLKKMISIFGKPPIIDFEANRVGYVSDYRQRRHPGFPYKHEREDVETWYIILNTAVPRGSKMPVEIYLDKYTYKVDKDYEESAMFGKYPVRIYYSYEAIKKLERHTLESLKTRTLSDNIMQNN